jgi:hypothetical protein
VTPTSTWSTPELVLVILSLEAAGVPARLFFAVLEGAGVPARLEEGLICFFGVLALGMSCLAPSSLSDSGASSSCCRFVFI